MASEVRVNKLTNRSGFSTITFADSGPVIAGVSTFDVIKVTADVGAATGTFTGAVSGTTGTFSGDVSIGGTLTYEDVTNIDSVGLITARSGINISSGQLNVGTASTLNVSGLNVTGIVTATSYYGSGANLSNLPASSPVGTGTDKVFWENGQHITGTYTIANWTNAGTFGPITVAAGKTVTIGTGSYWTIV